MYAEAGLQLPAFSQGFFQDHHGHCSHLPFSQEDFLSRFHVCFPDGAPSLGNMAQAPTVSEYDMGGEGDLFKAPEPILEGPALDPMAAAMSIITGGADIIAETIKVADVEAIQNDQLNDIYYECKKDLLEKSEIADSVSELLDVKIPAVQMDGVPLLEKLSYAERSMQKSELDFEAALGLRRAYSEADIQNLGNKNTSTGNATVIISSIKQLPSISDLKTEQRQQKLSRYREKKSKRNFGRKIKYACRKALAESQPRVRGRFAKTEEPNMSIQILN
ncbi:CCT motif family protein [Musa troglodytarum]|uniref:CCT motif family protein n=1 Tax=Musa troglodytarum TaxID=320322 RepID=A0A9E7HTZ6_9LILI|nr:CCT motif family protein [Musa troglodytarum]